MALINSCWSVPSPHLLIIITDIVSAHCSDSSYVSVPYDGMAITEHVVLLNCALYKRDLY